MRSPFSTPFGAVFQAEVLFNAKRVAPYAVAIFFGVNAWVWCTKGPAASMGWTTNSDFYIARLLKGFSVATLPL